MSTTVIPSQQRELTCFVVIGFGRKTDFRSGRTLDLDLTYSKLIKPACDLVTGARINCFRAIDVNQAGSIDKIMYHWLYHADIIIADLSTQNSNVMYELGVRHAQKPDTTIIMSEDGIFSALPFDLSHTVIHSYKHLGEEISDDEAARFTGHLAGIIDKILTNDEHMDSPIYTYMVGMEPPEYIAPADRIKQLQEALAGQAGADTAVDVKDQAVAVLVQQAEAARKEKDWVQAITLIDLAIQQLEEAAIADRKSTDEAGAKAVSKEVFLYQRKALLTYKQSEKNPIDDDAQNRAAIVHLHAAMNVLADADDPLTSNDPETLGLAGAINKRLWERTRDEKYLDLSIQFYERGFYIAQDYYNGINVAFMYSVKADESPDLFDATVFHGHASLLRKKVAEVCEQMRATPEWVSRGDRVWVLLSLAEAYYASGQEKKAEALMPEIEGMNDPFALDSYEEQRGKLVPLLERFAARRAAVMGEAPGADAQAAATTTDPAAKAVRPAVTTAGSARTQIRPPGSIIIDLGSDAAPRSIDVQVKVDY